MLHEGDLITLNGHRYKLGSKIGGGLEGTVFDLGPCVDETKLDISKYVVKLINTGQLNDEQYRTIYRRILSLKRLGDRNKELRKRMSLPLELVGNDLGYVMKKMVGGESLKKYLDPQECDFKEWYRDRYTLNNRYNIIAGMFEALREIHINGLIFTDLSPNNIMVRTSPEGYSVFFIDTDNLRSRDDPYSGVLGTPGFMAPEIFRKKIPEVIGGISKDSKGEDVKNLLSHIGKISIDSDIFSAAVIAFELLTLHHPFVGDVIDQGTPEDEERAHRMETDYILKKGTPNTSTSGLVPAFDQITTSKIRELFYRTFVIGALEPNKRPTDQEFLDAFLEAKDYMVKCPHCGFTTIYSDSSTKCLGCDEHLGPYPILEICQIFSNLSPEDVINHNPVDESQTEADRKSYTISTIVLPYSDEKRLYLRHFEKLNNRGDIIGNISISEDDTVTMRFISDHYPKASIVTTRSGKEKVFPKTTQQFSSKGHWLLFDEYPGSTDYSYCRLVGEFKWK